MWKARFKRRRKRTKKFAMVTAETYLIGKRVFD